MLGEVTGIRLEPEPDQIYKTKRGDYRVTWKAGVYNSKDVEKIINGLGLPIRKHRVKDEE